MWHLTNLQRDLSDFVMQINQLDFALFYCYNCCWVYSQAISAILLLNNLVNLSILTAVIYNLSNLTAHKEKPDSWAQVVEPRLRTPVLKGKIVSFRPRFYSIGFSDKVKIRKILKLKKIMIRRSILFVLLNRPSLFE